MYIIDEAYLLGRVGRKGSFRPKQHALLFIKQGSIHMRVNKQEMVFGANQVLFIYNRNEYELEYISDDIKLFISSNSFSSNKIPVNFNRFQLFQIVSHSHDNILRIKDVHFNFVWDLLQKMNTLFHSNEISSYREDIFLNLNAAVVYYLVDIIQQNTQEQIASFHSRKEEISLNFLKLVFETYLQEKELKYYADKLNISIKYLSISVKDFTGFAPSHFIQTAVLDEACSLLASSQSSISEVAYQLGFSDQHAFSKFFKKKKGMNPKSFRKSMIEVDTI